MSPYEVLGIPRTASKSRARAAYRRLALIHHPDHNPNDFGAASRFQKILSAYRAVASGAAAGEAGPTTTPAGPRPDRYGCGRCGDSFPFAEDCPRCGVALCDRTAGPAVAPEDARVRAFLEAMESRPEPTEAWDERLPVPGLLVASCLAAAFVVAQLGPIGPSLLFAGFGAYVAAIEGHRRLVAD